MNKETSMRKDMLWLLLGGISSILLGFWGYQRGVRAIRSRRYQPISHVRIVAQLAELRTRAQTFDSTPYSELPHHGCPNVQQWLVLLQQHPMVAHTIIHQLLMRLYHAGVNTESVVIASIESYHATLAYLDEQHQQTKPVQPTLQEYPTEAEWQQLLQTDRARAQEIARLMLLQDAHFGLHAPTALQQSLAAFHRVMAAASDSGSAATST